MGFRASLARVSLDPTTEASQPGREPDAEFPGEWYLDGMARSGVAGIDGCE